MLFNSYIFVLLFLPFVVSGYYFLHHFGWEKPALTFLITMSMIFYGYNSISYLLILIVSILLTILVLMQEGKTQGLGSLGGGMNDSSYWGKNKSRSMEGTLEKITKVLAVLFLILAFALNLKWLN